MFLLVEHAGSGLVLLVIIQRMATVFCSNVPSFKRGAGNVQATFTIQIRYVASLWAIWVKHTAHTGSIGG